MGRKSHYINKITTNDAEMLKSFSRVGYLSNTMLKDNLGIAERRITNFVRDKYIEKCSYLNKTTKITEEVFRLTDKGRKFIIEELAVVKFYRSSSAAHDLGLAKKYFTLSIVERDTWKTESELRDNFRELLDQMRDDECYGEIERMLENHCISSVDACYVNDQGINVGIEITTFSYGQEEINSKEEFSNLMGITTEYIRI